VRKYIGTGAIAARIASMDAMERERSAESRVALGILYAPVRGTDATADSLYTSVEKLLRDALHAAGYQQHDRGVWRMRRG
jgi:hypothetical protein